MKRVKGTALVNFVKTIRANKSGVYDMYLTQEDKDIISRKIVSAVWYPYETFKHCFKATFEVIAKKKLEIVEQWGKWYGELIMTDIYKDMLKKGDPLDNIRKVPVYIRTFFDFGQGEAVVENPKRVVLKLTDYDPEFAPLYHFLRGWFQKMAELCDAKNVKCEFLNKSWEDKSNTTTYLITWD